MSEDRGVRIMHEAPASCNAYVDFHGYKVQITLRDEDECRLLQRMQRMLALFPLGEAAMDAAAVAPEEAADRPPSARQLAFLRSLLERAGSSVSAIEAELGEVATHRDAARRIEEVRAHLREDEEFRAQRRTEAASVETDGSREDWCGVHQAPMKKNEYGWSHQVAPKKYCAGKWCETHNERFWPNEGRFGVFYSHKLAGGGFCQEKKSAVAHREPGEEG